MMMQNVRTATEIDHSFASAVSAHVPRERSKRQDQRDERIVQPTHNLLRATTSCEGPSPIRQ